MEITNDFQAKYAAAILNRQAATGKLEKLIPVFLQSGLEVYPHQIEAALCALHNPYAKGYILADEVGLGKAVEAGLVISQTFYDGNDNIIVVVPNGHIDDWQTLLGNKLGLPVEKVSNIDTLKPKDEKTIKVITYENAVVFSNALGQIEWDLVVIDEAHRLRKFRQTNSRTPDAIYAAFKKDRKLLLTGTPIIGNVMDLWGLMAFIDDTVFPDQGEFYKRYYKKSENNAELREALAPFIFRTLRRQVKVDVSLPERFVHTQLYKMNENELKLYKALEKYLGKLKKVAFPEMDPYELNLMFFKLMSSSVYALGKTLAGILCRLKKSTHKDAETETAEIEQLLELSSSIVRTGKGEVFLNVLAQTFHSLKEKNLPQKAIVFTENRETKDYIIKLIQKHTKFNCIEFKNSGSIETFKVKSAHILVATDIASESFNMEFASTVFNFDLPWSLQKVEQRIGRVHRIGQKSDVLVFNFLCNENFADVRLYELCFRRSATTADLLGVSDNFISSATDGTLQTVADMVATGRNAAEVFLDFAELQERFSDYADENKHESNETLFNTFDKRVAEKTKNYVAIIRKKISETRALLWNFCKYAIKGYGTINEAEKSISIHRSLFKSGNIPTLSLYLSDDGTRSKSSLITLTNYSVKQLLNFFTIGHAEYGSIFATDSLRQMEHGMIAFYNILFHCDGNQKSVPLLLGQSDDGRLLSDEECQKILISCTAAHRNDLVLEKLKDKSSELLLQVFPKIEAQAAVDLNDGVAAETKQIKRRTSVALANLEAAMSAAEAEIKRLNLATAERSDNAFAKNQQAQDNTNRLNGIKQNEFVEKMKFKKQEAEEIAELTAKAKLFSFKDCRFVVEYTLR